MSEYVASNGYRIELSGGAGYVRNIAGHERHVFGRYTVDALREFFQHERDEELGRWRNPESPRCSVYPTEGFETDEITILDEVDGECYTITRGEVKNRGGLWHSTARAYFKAHPERKPWEDAKPGEHWELTAEGGTREYVAILSNGKSGEYIRFFPIADLHAVTLGVGATVVTDGRRIWPEGDAS